MPPKGTNTRFRVFAVKFMEQRKEISMSDSSGASGILGVLVGVMLVIFVGVGVLMYSGKFGPAPATFSIKMPDGK